MNVRATPANVHAGEHTPGDIQFLHGMAASLQGSVATASAHMGDVGHPQVAALAGQIASSHAAQLSRVTQLQGRLGTAAAGAPTAAAAAGTAVGGRAAAPAKPYGNVTYADPGYQSDGKARYPLDSADHVKAAWSYINMGKNAAQYSSSQLATVKGRIRAAAKKFGIEIANNSASDPSEEFRSLAPMIGEAEGFRWDADGSSEQREAAFEMVASADGWSFEGYAAVFNSPTQIRDWDGDFEETIAPGAFARTLRERTPVFMFEHGKHPLLGNLPLGVIDHASEDSRGLYVRARLTDNWLVQPVRDAIRDGGVHGMSFRFSVPDGGDTWTHRNTKRTVHDLDMPELGPVVFPAYKLTTAQVRSALDCIDCNTGEPGAGSAGRGDPLRVVPGNGNAHALSALRTRDRVLRMRGVLR